MTGASDIGITATDFTANALTDLGVEVDYYECTKTTDNLTGDENLSYGNSETLTLVFLKRTKEYEQGVEGRIELGDAYCISEYDEGIETNDKIVYQDTTYRVKQSIIRRINGEAMFTYSILETISSSVSTIGPFGNNDSTLLLCHYNNFISGYNGEIGYPSTGLGFVIGKWGNAIEINDTEWLKYETSGNFDKEEGTLEFWIKLNTKVTDMTDDLRLFEIKIDSNNYFNLKVDHTFDKITFVINSGGNKENAKEDSANTWEIGEWHHIAITWEKDKTIHLYLDGVAQADTGNWQDLGTVPTYMYIGSNADEGQQIDASFEELRILSTFSREEDILADYNRGI